MHFAKSLLILVAFLGLVCIGTSDRQAKMMQTWNKGQGAQKRAEASALNRAANKLNNFNRMTKFEEKRAQASGMNPFNRMSKFEEKRAPEEKSINPFNRMSKFEEKRRDTGSMNQFNRMAKVKREQDCGEIPVVSTAIIKLFEAKVRGIEMDRQLNSADCTF